MIFDELIIFLKDNGFRRVSVHGANKQSYINEDYTVTVTVEEHKDTLTPEEEAQIKKRLEELGYL